MNAIQHMSQILLREPLPPGPTGKLLYTLRQADEPMTARQLADVVDCNSRDVSTLLYRQIRDGRVSRARGQGNQGFLYSIGGKEQ